MVELPAQGSRVIWPQTCWGADSHVLWVTSPAALIPVCCRNTITWLQAEGILVFSQVIPSSLSLVLRGTTLALFKMAPCPTSDP